MGATLVFVVFSCNHMAEGTDLKKIRINVWPIDAGLRGRCWRLWSVSWMSPLRWPWATLPVWGKMEPLWLWTLWSSSTANQVRLSYPVSNKYCICLFSHAPKEPCWLLIKVKKKENKNVFECPRGICMYFFFYFLCSWFWLVSLIKQICDIV